LVFKLARKVAWGTCERWILLPLALYNRVAAAAAAGVQVHL